MAYLAPECRSSRRTKRTLVDTALYSEVSILAMKGIISSCVNLYSFSLGNFCLMKNHLIVTVGNPFTKQIRPICGIVINNNRLKIRTLLLEYILFTKFYSSQGLYTGTMFDIRGFFIVYIAFEIVRLFFYQ